MRWNALYFAMDMNFVIKYSFCWAKLDIMNETRSLENLILFQITFFFETASCIAKAILRNLDNFPPGEFYSSPPLQLGVKEY